MLQMVRTPDARICSVRFRLCLALALAAALSLLSPPLLHAQDAAPEAPPFQALSPQDASSQAPPSQDASSQAPSPQAPSPQDVSPQAPAPQDLSPGDPAAEEPAAQEPASPDPAAAETPAVYRGALAFIWGDLLAPAQNGQQQIVATELSGTLFTPAGAQIPLQIPPDSLAAAGGAPALNGHAVEVRGVVDAAGTLHAETLSLLDGAEEALAGASPDYSAPRPVSGSHPWVVLLCRGEGAGIVHEEDALPYYDAVMNSNPYGADHYWRELSYGKVNVAGSRAAGWFDLPDPAAAYQESYNGGITLIDDKSANDCTAAADPTINFANYDGIVLIVPVPPQEGPASYWFFGGITVLKLDGKERMTRIVWMPLEIAPSGEGRATGSHVLHHEMGHGFGLPHSSGPYDETYDSAWDIMSFSGSNTCRQYDNPYPYSCPGQHTIAIHKHWLGWLNPSTVLTLTTNSVQEVLLNSLALPQGNGLLLIKSPIDGDKHYYTVEARLERGYDRALPQGAVVIHDVDLSRTSSPARVVDPDGNGSPNDAAAQWQPGERFDGAGGFTLCVKARTPEGYIVLAGRTADPAAVQCRFAADLAPSRYSADALYPTGGQTVTLQLDLVNYQAPAANVVVTAAIPAATTYVSGTAKSDIGTTRVVTGTSGDQIVFTVGSLTYEEPVALTYSVVVTDTVAAPTVITHGADIAWDGGKRALQVVQITDAAPLYLPLLRR
jgi:M6 family metalloprotease-like protein/uncharacterized repeat protein (TIGR01451 family)